MGRVTAVAIAFLAVGVVGQPSAVGRTTPSATTLTCGGEVPLPKPGGGTWSCTFDDEFSQDTSLNPVWTPVLSSQTGVATGTAPYRACYVNTPDNVSVNHGRLQLTVRREKQPFTCNMGINPSFTTYYTVGAVSTVGTFGRMYGRFEVRAKLPDTAIKGLQETLWLWPTNDVKYAAYGPAWAEPTGEIDFGEFYSAVANYDIPYLHYYLDSSTINVSTGTNVYTPFQPPYNEPGTSCTFDYTTWNTFSVVWQPGRLSLYADSQLCLVDNYVPAGGPSSPAPFDQPFFIALSQALGVKVTGSDNATTAQTPIPSSTLVSYVRVWK
ncbi:MAG TPA: glycoside hydrolase family 16 protein [Jatrophihabitantaceae bacterium]|nr:glycoside hydrolase family 16 protein [Jatrophihabitantaceae bacterium]